MSNLESHQLVFETSRIKQFFIEGWILFRIQLSIIRESWALIFILASVFPFTTLMFLKFFTENPSDELIMRMITGNMLFALIIMGMNVMAQDISSQKHQGHFTFYASLPIAKLNFVLANLFRGMLMSFPSFIILGVIGQVVYEVQFKLSFGIIPVAFLTIMSVVGIGVFLGFWSPNLQLTNLLVQALMMFVSFLTPIMVDINQLPVILKWVSYMFPTTYAATALRELLIVGWTWTVTVNTLVLLCFTLVSYILIVKKINWRMES
ncbi:ABC transporter permease [Salipaludibacillus agaradhaerens]|uniref:Transport permease protein n=1 Tax=Salipaludibacillus agaradhaerens TaxID=76935 RepID=A0A9Q4B0J0_SALAG|nr:ABC transporter permease [Salipaludibacillus agaradhaerens]MCR6095770.1 ABC transporter permease [Salipaludibacillus agaradhaerens]MCR6114670.1 ABC transporter permease [Salipaludibacillus agaradhaerens]